VEARVKLLNQQTETEIDRTEKQAALFAEQREKIAERRARAAAPAAGRPGGGAADAEEDVWEGYVRKMEGIEQACRNRWARSTDSRVGPSTEARRCQPMCRPVEFTRFRRRSKLETIHWTSPSPFCSVTTLTVDLIARPTSRPF